MNAVDRWYKPWFYTHVLDLMFNNKDDNENNNKTNRKYVEYIPTKDYFHRHNKCIFWMLRYDFGFANHPLFRYTGINEYSIAYDIYIYNYLN